MHLLGQLGASLLDLAPADRLGEALGVFLVHLPFIHRIAYSVVLVVRSALIRSQRPGLSPRIWHLP